MKKEAYRATLTKRKRGQALSPVKVQKTMKKVNAIVTYDSRDKVVCTFSVCLRDGDMINLSSLINAYKNIDDLINKCVAIAKNNGFEIPFKEVFGGRKYAITFIDYREMFTPKQIVIARLTSL